MLCLPEVSSFRWAIENLAQNNYETWQGAHPQYKQASQQWMQIILKDIKAIMTTQTEALSL